MCVRAAFLFTALGIFCTGAPGEDAQPNLDRLGEDYASACREIDRSLDELGAKYRIAVRELYDASRAKADLDGAVAAEAEGKRFDLKKAPPSNISEHRGLARLQEIYRGSYEDTLAQNREKKVTADNAYRESLSALIRELTMQAKIEEAVRVQNVLKKFESPARLNAGLVLHLRFEDLTGKTVPDLSGAGNGGQLMGRAQIRRSAGIRESFVSLDYSGDFIRCDHSESLSLTTDGTISIWIRPRELRDLRGIVCKYTPENAYTFRVSASPGQKPTVMFGDYDNTNVCASEIALDRWTHLLVTLADNRVNFYVDGKFDSGGERPKEKPLATNTNPVRIGSDYDGRYFHGDVDDVRIYSRALTGEEVAALFMDES